MPKQIGHSKALRPIDQDNPEGRTLRKDPECKVAPTLNRTSARRAAAGTAGAAGRLVPRPPHIRAVDGRPS